MEKEEKSVVQENSTKEQSMEEKRPLKRKLRYPEGCRKSCEVADAGGACGMYCRSSQYAVFFCAERCDELQEREWMDILSAACDGADHCVSV